MKQQAINDKIIRLFNEVFAGLELENKESTIDPYCYSPYLKLYISWNAYRESTKKKEQVFCYVDTSYINMCFFECEPDYVVRGWLRSQIMKKIERINK